MKDEQKCNNNNSCEKIKNQRAKNRKSYMEQDTEDIIKKLSQITPSDDKSFESSLINTKNLPYKLDKNFLMKNNIIEPFNIFQEINNDKYLENNNSCIDDAYINNNQISLNQKLKYICSMIQISNINIKNYDDLRQFYKYLYNNDLIMNHYKPINILFDIINELIFYIKKELKNNNILINEIKRLKYNRSDNEKQIYKLKALMKEKDKELNELRPIKNDKYYKYSLNEINELKHENKELFKKINTYKSQMKKVESNNRKIVHKLNSFNKGRKTIYNTSSNLLGNRVLNINNPHSLYAINNLNSSFDEIGFKSLNKNTLNQINNILNYQNKTINNSSCFSPMKTINFKKLNDTNINVSQNNNINNNNKNNRNSIISNIRLLLKEINEMLNIYNSSLEKLQIGNCMNSNNKNNNKKETDSQIPVFIEDKNMTFISKEFINKMDEIIKKMENYLDNDNKNKNKDKKISHNKIIQVNKSNFKIKKKTTYKKIEKNSINKENNDENTSLRLKNSRSFYKKNKENIILHNNTCKGYGISFTKKIKEKFK